jgi:cytochrome c-type biogenesis protein CcmH
VNLAFLASATAMMVTATTLLVYPTLRTGRATGRLRGSLGWIAAITVLLPVGALGLYLMVGTPAALDRSAHRPVAASTSVDEALAQLRAEAQGHPDQLPPWLLLGRAAATMKKPDVALDAFGHALKIAPNDPDVMVAYAEAVAVKSRDHRLDEPTRAVLERAIRIDPRHQHGLLLLGVADYQDGRFKDAANRWKQLLALLPSDSAIAAAISSHIADAEARVPGKPTGPSAQAGLRQH